MTDQDGSDLVRMKSAMEKAHKLFVGGRWTAAIAVIEDAIKWPSPTPYVRPAAEIRAEIERRKRPSSFYEDAAEESFDRGFRSGAAFALTPPTQEPR